MSKLPEDTTIAALLGPWVEPDWDSGLIGRCRMAWNKPLRDLSNEELATLLRQRIAVEHILPLARKRVEDGIEDDTEMYEGELEAAIEYATSDSKEK
jgi:hypothetical protein